MGVEHSRRVALPESVHGLAKLDDRSYGDSRLSAFAPLAGVWVDGGGCEAHHQEAGHAANE